MKRKAKDLGRVKRTMRRVFGIEKLRPGQAEVIESVLSGQNTLAIMPTGAGKSLCYQIPALHLPGTTVIVSPLISLMKDQVDKLEDAGIEAAQLNSALSAREREENVEQVERQQSRFVFTTPERMVTPEFLATLENVPIDFVVIDESHCISEWGHDFRPAYLALGSAIKALASPPVLALTATATAEVVGDIQKQLGLRDMQVVNTGIYRPNLCYEVLRVTNEEVKRGHLTRLLSEIGGSGIVYCATVKAVNELVSWLDGSVFPVRAYHGRLPARERRENQDLFMQGALKAMIATNAFGMGIDKPDIRFVIHYQLPGSLEAYYQESGRAGRDGEPARCILFYQLNDRRTHLYFMGNRYPGLEHMAAVYETLKAMGAENSAVSLREIQTAAGIPKNKVAIVLHLLKDTGVVHEARYARFKLLKGGIEAGELDRLSTQCEERMGNDRAKLEQMMLYGQSAACRWRLLHEYFNEEFGERCGTCDNCVRPLEQRLVEERAGAPADA